MIQSVKSGDNGGGCDEPITTEAVAATAKPSTTKPTAKRRQFKPQSISKSAAKAPESPGPDQPPDLVKEPFRPKACQSCKDSHVSCGYERPCPRCIRSGKADCCVDAQPKKRGRPTNESRLADERDGVKRPPKRARAAAAKEAKAAPLSAKQRRDDERRRADIERQLAAIFDAADAPAPCDAAKLGCLTPATSCSVDSFAPASAQSADINDKDFMDLFEGAASIVSDSTLVAVDEEADPDLDSMIIALDGNIHQHENIPASAITPCASIAQSVECPTTTATESIDPSILSDLPELSASDELFFDNLLNEARAAGIAGSDSLGNDFDFLLENNVFDTLLKNLNGGEAIGSILEL
ncbi:hypothetical protein BDR26DRAFT_922412 [Obelidium mucronatum]|nr:hypothetical protein BDR26DRAFT_922412 [Obelidium mucronatum]